LDPTTFKRISDLEQVHEAIAAAVLGWRVALLTGQATDTRQKAADALLRWHMRSEETVILPVYAERVAEPAHGGSVALISRDHRIIEAHLDALAGLTGSEALSRLARLAETLEHHDEREGGSYVAQLPDHLSPEEEGAMMVAASVGFSLSWLLDATEVDAECRVNVVELAAAAIDRSLSVRDARFARKLQRLQRDVSDFTLHISTSEALDRLAAIDRLNRFVDAAERSQRE
jgi:hypothetical protein